MKPAIEQAVADAIPHGDRCLINATGWRCTCTANRRRNVLLAKLATPGGYVYLDRKH